MELYFGLMIRYEHENALYTNFIYLHLQSTFMCHLHELITLCIFLYFNGITCSSGKMLVNHFYWINSVKERFFFEKVQKSDKI